MKLLRIVIATIATLGATLAFQEEKPRNKNHKKSKKGLEADEDELLDNIEDGIEMKMDIPMSREEEFEDEEKGKGKKNKSKKG